MLQLVHRVILMAVIAVWFGGFTFYTSVVVPVGTDVLGSSTTQGFVTRTVTHLLNLIGAATLGWGVLNLFVEWKLRSRRVNYVLTGTLAFLLACWLTLWVVHPMMDRMLEPEHQYVNEGARFYQLHRVYLWVSTVQWLGCWVWLFLIIRTWTIPRPASENPT